MINFLDNINEICALLKEGKIILCPTDTIWGISCDIFHEQSVNRIYQIKKRDRNKPFIILVNNIEMLKKYIKDLHPRVETLLLHHKKPLTIIHQAGDLIPEYLLCGNKTIAIRITSFPLLNKLITHLDHPIVSTSANIQNEESPTCFNNIDPKVIESVDYTCLSCRDSKEDKSSSTLISYSGEGELFFLR